MVYTIEENCFECDQCKYGDQAKYDPNINRRCCDLDAHPSRNCPLEIKENRVSGFYIGFDENGNQILSSPGEYGYEGLETFIGIDGKFYFTREEAEAEMKKREEVDNDD